jgi:hypothetical protein
VTITGLLLAESPVAHFKVWVGVNQANCEIEERVLVPFPLILVNALHACSNASDFKGGERETTSF